MSSTFKFLGGKKSFESKTLMHELVDTQKKYKLGDKKREKIEDGIYDKLEEITKSITIEPYDDKHNMFTKTNPSTVSYTFMDFMTDNLNDRKLEDDTDMKDIVYDSMKNCNRKEWLKKMKNQTCYRCWHQSFEFFFILTAKTFLLDLHNQSQKILDLYKDKKILMYDAEDLLKLHKKSIKQFENVINKSQGKHTIVNLEKLFSIMTTLTNEIMMRYTLNKNIQESNQTGKFM